MSAGGSSHIVRWLEGAVLLCAILFFALHSLPRAWRTLNTDFPNYYLAARLVHEGYETSRMYEWQWIEREKDHRAIDERVIGLLPITPLSTLAMYPLSGLAPLTAKHIWILFNIALLLPLAWILRSMTGMRYHRIAMAMLLSFPLHRNLLYGQFYIVLLLLIATACLCHLKGLHALSGSLIAIAAACKVFPLLFFVFFLQRRDWRAPRAGAITLIGSLALSVTIFGTSAHRTWLQEILPWVMRGEGLGTYSATASFPAILHRLFLSEPQWNPHPWHDSPMAYALLSQLLPMLTLAPAILLIDAGDRRRSKVMLEWAALLTAALAVSTIPASYNFVLMVLPVCVVVQALLSRRRYLWLGFVITAYLVIGFPLPVPENPPGLSLLLHVPRLPCMLFVLGVLYMLLWEDRSPETGTNKARWIAYAWTAAMAASVMLGVRSTMRNEQQQRTEYAYRLPLQAQGFLNQAVEAADGSLTRLSFTLNGYQITANETDGHEFLEDQIAFAQGRGALLVERAVAPLSGIVDVNAATRTVATDAHDPVLSADGSDLAFLRDDHGKGRLILRQDFRSETAERVMTPEGLNAYEAALYSRDEYAFSGTGKGGAPGIFLFTHGSTGVQVELPASRYPAFSPDGRWLVYSHLQSGTWNLWLRDLSSNTSHRIATVPCNQIYPSWEHDSQTVLYSTDCGRSVWFTAIARRKVLPLAGQ
jgi:hypothetical protein